MSIGSTAVARAMQTVLAFAEMSTKTGEMATAANTVISERVALMAQATRDPLAGDYAEFARMLPEKVTAMHQACAALLDGWWALQRDAGDYMIYYRSDDDKWAAALAQRCRRTRRPNVVPRDPDRRHRDRRGDRGARALPRVRDVERTAAIASQAAMIARLVLREHPFMSASEPR